jgi:hypothetical protein
MRTENGQTVAWVVAFCGVLGVVAALLSGPGT